MTQKLNIKSETAIFQHDAYLVVRTFLVFFQADDSIESKGLADAAIFVARIAAALSIILM